MRKVKPLKYWRSAIDIHRIGTTPNPKGKDVVEVPDDMADYLVQNNLAIEVTGDSEQDEKKAGLKKPNPKVEDQWKIDSLDYLRSHSAAEISDEIDGIGIKTAEAIKSEGVGGWEEVKKHLSSSQINNIKKKFS